MSILDKPAEGLGGDQARDDRANFTESSSKDSCSTGGYFGGWPAHVV